MSRFPLRKFPLHTSTAMLLCLATLPAFAAETEAAIEEVTVMDHAIHVASSAPPTDVTQPTSAIEKEFIQNNIIPLASFDDIVKFAPSVWDQSPNGPGLGKSETLSIRGFQDSPFNVTFDGIPFGDATDLHHTSSALFIAHDIGQATVDRGPGSASTIGSATFGGTLDFNTKNPLDSFTANVYSTYVGRHRFDQRRSAGRYQIRHALQLQHQRQSHHGDALCRAGSAGDAGSDGDARRALCRFHPRHGRAAQQDQAAGSGRSQPELEHRPAVGGGALYHRARLDRLCPGRRGFMAPPINLLEVSGRLNSVKPEVTWNYQAGSSMRRNDWIVGLDAYYIDFSNYIASTTSDSVTTYLNGGGAVYKGVESEVQYVLGKGFSLYGNASWNDAKYKGTAVLIALTPEWTAAAGMLYDDPEGLHFSVIGKWIGGRFGNDVAADAP